MLAEGPRPEQREIIDLLIQDEEAREMRVRVESDGTVNGTRVYDRDTGAPVPHAYVGFSHRPGDVPIAIIELPGAAYIDARASASIDCEAAVVVQEPPREG